MLDNDSNIDLAIGDGEPLLRGFSFLTAPLSFLHHLCIATFDRCGSTRRFIVVAIVEVTFACRKDNR